MRCHVGLKSEFKDDFTEHAHNAVYGNKDVDGIEGVADIRAQQAWIFIDKIVRPRDIFSQTIKAIVGTTVHELVHLCGYEDETVATRAEGLLAWDGWAWCYRPLPLAGGG